MWIFTKDGFFSVVKDNYCGEGELMVRSRVKKDLERFLVKTGLSSNIITLAEADYRYRIKVKKEAWSKYCAQEADGIDYSNVKGTIAPYSEPERADAYYGCWNHLNTFQQVTAGLK
jgi:hypothetical protein